MAARAAEEGFARRQARRTVIDLSSASLEELKALPGVGAKRAAAIDGLRSEGRLASVGSLGGLPGFGAALVESIGRVAFVHPELGLRSAGGGRAAEEEDAARRRRCHQLLVGAWNVRNLGRKALESDRAGEVAAIVAEYDVVALLELRDVEVVEGLLRLLGKERWSAAVSPLVGTDHHKEIYAFLYRSEAVQLLRSDLLNDRFDRWVREPFLAHFRAPGGFDFVAAAVHVVWGNTVAERRQEVEALSMKLQRVTSWQGERDVLLMGDFNVEPSDAAWKKAREAGWVPLLEGDGLKSMVRDTHLYDNIWAHGSNTAASEWLGASGVIRFDQVLDFGSGAGAAKRAVKEFSDHRPTWALFAADVDDDGSAGGRDPPLFG